LVAALKALRNQLVHKEGPLNLFMLFCAEPTPIPSWNLIVSSAKLDKKSRAEALKEITELLRKQHSDALEQITRATVLRTSDPFVQAFNSAFSTKNQVLNIIGTHISGFDIPRAILVDSQRNAA
jgi:hypothetical protein